MPASNIESICELHVFDKIRNDERIDLLLSFLNDLPEGYFGSTVDDTCYEMTKRHPETEWDYDGRPSWRDDRSRYCIEQLGEKLAKIGLIRYFIPGADGGFPERRLIITDIGKLYITQKQESHLDNSE